VGFGQLNIVVMALVKGAGEGNNPDQPWPPFCDLKRAGALRASLMAQVQTDSITGPPISECIEKSLATREQDLDPRTLNQYRFTPERFRRFLEAQNVVHMREMNHWRSVFAESPKGWPTPLLPELANTAPRVSKRWEAPPPATDDAMAWGARTPPNSRFSGKFQLVTIE
jgi:hypothetical protein